MIYPFSDFGTGFSQNQMGTLGSDEFNTRRLAVDIPYFSFPGLFERKENPVLLSCEYLNRMNRPVDIFASEQFDRIRPDQLESVLSISGIFPLRRSIDLRRRKGSIYLIELVSYLFTNDLLLEQIATTTISSNIRIFDFRMDLHLS